MLRSMSEVPFSRSTIPNQCVARRAIAKVVLLQAGYMYTRSSDTSCSTSGDGLCGFAEELKTFHEDDCGTDA